MSLAELQQRVRKHQMLRGHRLRLFDIFCQAEGLLSLRDIQKSMMGVNCIHQDLIQDLIDWNVIKVVGVTLHRETGAAINVYQLTGSLPKIPNIVEYKDLVE